MKFKRLKRTPLLIAFSVLALICGVRALHLDFLERLERMTYDLRVRANRHFPAPAAKNLAFVSIEESSLKAVQNGKFGYHFGLLWPRQVYGRLVDELSAQGAEAVGFDVLFGERRPDHPSVLMADGIHLEQSDDFFGEQLRRAGNVILAMTPELVPPGMFATNALALGDISTDRDSDGILRRVKAFRDLRRWHPLFQQIEDNPELGVSLTNAIFAPGKIILPQTGLTNAIEIPVDAENNFALADFGVDKLPPGVAPTAKAFTTDRVWHMGILLAAQQLKLDLAQSTVDLSGGKIVLRGTNGVRRVIPVDADGYFLVDWRLTPNDSRLLRAPVESLLWQDHQRLLGETNGLRDDFRGKLVVVGFAVQGNDLTDRGATPLEHDTLLVSKHWNIANSVITGQFLRRLGSDETLAIIILLGLMTMFLAWQLPMLPAAIATILLLTGYSVLTFVVFIKNGLWLPLFAPVYGSAIGYISLVTYRVVFEEHEQRRVKSVFSKIVSPDVVTELLGAEKISLGGLRREVTVLFADVRGFTTFTDQLQEDIAEYIRTHNVDLVTAEKYYEESARETLETVNLYLAAVADAVKNHGGTLDKYIGDCVMAFWNAPIPNPRHAPAAVAAAIEAQRAIHQLNEQRLAENSAREVENRTRMAAGLPAKPLHVALQLGTGINSGLVTVGLMGSNQHILNYTVFGREVNLASRLEGVSGSGRIIISDTTYNHLLRHAPAMAATCNELFPVQVKGIKNAVRIYEVAWK